MPRALVIYHYFELDDLHRENLEFFLRHAFDDEADFLFVIAGGCTLELPVAPNVSYLHMPNAGGDFAGYASAIHATPGLERYSHFIFLNSTVRGPFRPAYSEGSWISVFTGMLRGDVHLAGATINILDADTPICTLFAERYGMRRPFSHVQSMIFALDLEGLSFLLDRNFFSRPIGPGKLDVIADYEILMSQLIISNGWNITCLLPEYCSIDYRTVEGDINPSSLNGDPCCAGAYFGRSLSPYEVVFIKTNRDVIAPETLHHVSRSQDFSPAIASAFDRCTFERVLSGITSAWRGHKNFALWLVNRLRPAVTVELGVDFGFSSLCFAYPRVGQVYGVDSFQGDEHAGFRDTQSHVESAIRHLRLGNVSLIKGYFSNVARGWSQYVDLLHIDGRHDYEDVREDFQAWFPFLSARGVVLMHDTCVPHFGVRRFFDEIDMPKLNLWTSHGLGILSRDTALINEIALVFEKQVETKQA
jgi:hypothetical protein